MDSNEHVLEVESLDKSFPGVQAVRDVSFSLRSGELLAVLGENGAGKSTLMQLISGAQQPDRGTILVDGVEVAFSSPVDAIRAGIAMVFQELSLAPNLSVAENVFANRQPVGNFNIIRWRELRQHTQELLDRFSVKVDPRTPIKYLPSAGTRQLVEIMKALSTEPRVLILDEPTSSLAEPEIKELFALLRRLKDEGVAVLYITHKLSEVFEVGDRVLVMRDGECVSLQPVPDVTENDLVTAMVGRGVSNLYGTQLRSPERDRFFRVSNLRREGVFYDVGFELHRGELLGFAGLVGAGRTEVARAIFGIDRRDGGEIELEGNRLDIRGPRDAIEHGIAYVTEDRKEDGLYLSLPVRDNLIAPTLQNYQSPLGLVRTEQAQEDSEQRVKEYGIRTRSVLQQVNFLSGGNQQKVLLATWMGTEPKVLILDEPTRGVDVGARQEIYARLRQIAAEGIGIILISSEMPELIGVCDRLLVFHEGRITGSLTAGEFSEERILEYASGLANEITNERSAIADDRSN